jgi:hypothetical protein
VIVMMMAIINGEINFVQKEMAMETGLVLLEGNGGTIQVEGVCLPQVEEAQEPDGVEEVTAEMALHTEHIHQEGKDMTIEACLLRLKE